MVSRNFRLARRQFWHYDQSRDASWIGAFLHDGSPPNEVSYDERAISFAFPIHCFGARHLLLPSSIFRQQFVRVGMVHEFSQDFG
jgi:hypothetical protein